MMVSVEERTKMIEENRLSYFDLQDLTRYELYSMIWYLRGFVKDQIIEKKED